MDRMLYLDHIVIAATDPKDAAEAFARKHAVQITKGGRHDHWGTYNYLAYFSNSCYIEWLGVFDRKLAVLSDNPLIGQLASALEDGKEGPMQIAFRTDGINQFLSHFDAEGISYEGPFPGSRIRPDGSRLEWEMLFPVPSVNLPFLISWGETLNQPLDRSLVNKTSIEEISLPWNGKQLQSLYHLPFSGKKATLGNASITIDEGQPISFRLTKKTDHS